jgi:hypothetical protein
MLILKKAVDILRCPPTTGIQQAAEILQRASVANSSLAAAYIAEAAKTNLGADPPRRITAAVMLRRWRTGTGTLAVLGRQRVADGDSAVRRTYALAMNQHYATRGVKGKPNPPGDSSHPAPRGQRTVASYLRDRTAGSGVLVGQDAAAYAALMRALEQCHVRLVGDEPVTVVNRRPKLDMTVVEAALTRAAVADHLVLRLLDLAPHEWAVASAAAHVARQWAQRLAGNNL